MIVDCFPFRDEFKLLDVRLHELGPVVDKFVLVEATETYSRRSKPLHFQESRYSYADWPIEHVVVKRFPRNKGKFFRTEYQHNAIARGLGELEDDTVVFVSDLDEIFRREKVEEIAKATRKQPVVPVEMDFYVAFINWCRGAWSFGPCAFRLEQLAKKEVMDLRYAAVEAKRTGIPTVKDGGWHYSFVGGIDRIMAKLQCGSHTQFQRLTRAQIEERLESHEDVLGRKGKRPIDIRGPDFRDYPHLILEQPERFREWVSWANV